MGKKGVLLDNGKQAQSSMTLYWKKNRENNKHPRKKEEAEPVDEKEEMKNRADENLTKWKDHKQKIISK